MSASSSLAVRAFVTAPAPAAASEATPALYVSPSGTGTACSAAEPCSLPAAQAAVRSLNGAMSDDIVVELAGGVHRLSTPLRMTAADSGNNGHRVVWRAAPSARPVISGWSVADAGKNIWRADVDGAIATRARTQVNRSSFTFTSAGMTFSDPALGYLNNLAGQSRVEVESVNSFTDRYSPGAYLAGDWNWPADRLTSCQNGCRQFETARPHRNQMPAAVQVSAASGITFGDSEFVNLGQTAIGIGNDANGDRGNVVRGNVTVTGGNWPSGAQAVMANAGPRGGGDPSAGTIVGGQSGRCVGFGGAHPANGDQAQLRDCADDANQRWTHTSGKQLVVNGTLIHLWSCPGGANQKWSLR
ncbi:ricin-type beta-trefoil lectin domain protein [Streptomyces acidiscabies]|uniref:ricin-type beta-trefoil lectin domain protein n=1 Tax=Streptomyces acidiscabies TaxID=42234 RepID=UPI0038F62EAA